MTIALVLAAMMALAAAETRAAGAAPTPAKTRAAGAAPTPAKTRAAGAAPTPATAETRAAPVATRCTGRETRLAVTRFVAELNRGDLRALDRRFAPAERFEWYSTDAPGRRIDDAAKNRATLIPYFKARHARHERLTLRSFKYNGASQANYGNFEYTLTRRADDMRTTRYVGKGAAWCHRGPRDEIFVWSMARDQRG
jgi:hypothetical protein